MNNKETTQHRKLWVDLYKVSNGCCICGYNKHPAALCFDHLPGYEKAEITKNGCSKRSCAGGMFMLYAKKYDVEELISEIQKCRLVCHNCHMEHTHKNQVDSYDNQNGMSLEELMLHLREEKNDI
jgi:hypothetical protein